VVIDGRHPDRECDQQGEEADDVNHLADKLELRQAVKRRLVRSDLSARATERNTCRADRGRDLERGADGRQAERTDDEEDQQQPAPRKLKERVTGDRERAVHGLSSPAMNVGRLSRLGEVASTSSTKTSSRVRPSGT